MHHANVRDIVAVYAESALPDPTVIGLDEDPHAAATELARRSA